MVKSSDKAFCGVLDDVYQNRKYVTAMGVPRTITREDIQIAIGMAFIFGQTFVSPMRFLIDHRPFLDLCEDPKWAKLIFADQLVLPAAKETNLDRFINACTGTSKSPPLKMSSSESGNKVVEEAWNFGKDPKASRIAFGKEFPHAIDFVESLKHLDVQPVKYSKANLEYSRYFSRRLEELPLRRELADHFSEMSYRGNVFQKIEGFTDDLTEDEAKYLTHAAISAKHDEVADTLGVPRITKPVSHPFAGIGRGSHSLKVSLDLPALGGILSASYGAEALSALCEDLKFPTLRNDFVRARRREGRARSNDDISRTLERLCRRGAEVLGLKRGEHSARVWVATGTSLGVVAKAISAIPDPISGIFLGTGSVLIVAGLVIPHFGKALPYLTYDRRLYAELLRVGRGLY